MLGASFCFQWFFIHFVYTFIYTIDFFGIPNVSFSQFYWVQICSFIHLFGFEKPPFCLYDFWYILCFDLIWFVYLSFYLVLILVYIFTNAGACMSRRVKFGLSILFFFLLSFRSSLSLFVLFFKHWQKRNQIALIYDCNAPFHWTLLLLLFLYFFFLPFIASHFVELRSKTRFCFHVWRIGVLPTRTFLFKYTNKTHTTQISFQ